MTIHKLEYIKVDKMQLERESKICDYVPINRVTLKRLQMDKSNSSYGKKFSDYLDKEDKDWWMKQDTWQSSINADAEMLKSMPEVARILSMFKAALATDNIEANFFTQQKDTEVKAHIDVGTPCAINFIINGNATPIIFDESGTHFYTNALLDVSKRHSVPMQLDTERLVFKLRILDLTFNEAQKKIIDFFE
jgi:hypothetical protein